MAHQDKTAQGAGQLQFQETNFVELDKLSAEDMFAMQLEQHRTIAFERQHLFAKAAIGRMWRLDFAFPRYRIAVEINGVVVRTIGGERVVMGRHATIDGIRGDNEKLNTAQLMGWHVLNFLQSDVRPRTAINMTLRVLASRGWRANV